MNCKKIFKKVTSVNSEHRRAVDTIKEYKESKKYEDNLKTMEKMEGLKEDLENAYKTIDILTNNKYDFKKYEDNLETMKNMEADLENAYKTIDILAKNKYDPNNFDIYGNHKDTGNKYDPNGFDRNAYNIYGVMICVDLIKMN